ncbi:MAG: hypothetical protein MJB57_18570 [Gemmatimonadetes bacterium]|nr:hypothetical protein [Gemmatimonadota bacterium]
MSQGTDIQGPRPKGRLTTNGLLREIRAHDDRLSREMDTDTRIQFGTARFSITAAAILLGAVIAWSQRAPGSSSAILFLLPVAILLPASLTILNRARTRNRKAAYVIAILDTHRLRLQGDGDLHGDSLHRRLIPWETALHLAFRKTPHSSGAIRNSLCATQLLEFACVYLAGWQLIAPPEVNGGTSVRAAGFAHPAAFVALFVIVIVGFWIRRVILYRRLKYDDSIQEYTKLWLKRAYDPARTDWPPHLAKYVENVENSERS